MRELKILKGTNSYAENIQGKANEPITVAGLLDRARYALKFNDIEYPLEAIYDRLEENAPRVGIIGGSLDHPAHVVDWETVLKAAYAVWKMGGAPFYFSIPVVCDGTAQSNMGMCYSLQSRNAAAAMVVNQMEGQSYHGAFVIQGCDKTPMAVLSGLAALDNARQRRGDAPVFATFAPAHVLKGGEIPQALRERLEETAVRAERMGKPQFAEDIRGTAKFILQCASDQAFKGIFDRMTQEGVIDEMEKKALLKQLAVNTCDGKGGICAFNGTGNSSRHAMSAFGMAHPSLELLTEPPNQRQIDDAVRDLLGFCNDPDYSVSNIVKANIENCVRVFSATGGSTNLVMHLIAVMLYAGVRFSLDDLETIIDAHPIPDIFDYSLTEGRDIFALAQQCCDGQIRGMETVLYELQQNGVPVHLDAPTATGTTWRERLSNAENLSADGVKENPIILSKPRRAYSGIDVLKGNFFDSAVVKISGMKAEQIEAFDEKAHFGLYYENEEEATDALLNPRILHELRDRRVFPRGRLEALARFNSPRFNPDRFSANDDSDGYNALFDAMVEERALKMIVFISGQGPAAYGMPEQFSPTQYINHNADLNPLVVLMSDGRYSGVSYGAAIGHVVPEAGRGGGILYLQTGDLFLLQLKKRRVTHIDPGAFLRGEAVPSAEDLSETRRELGEERLKRIRERRRQISPTNLMTGASDASLGVAPADVVDAAGEAYEFKG